MVPRLRIAICIVTPNPVACVRVGNVCGSKSPSRTWMWSSEGKQIIKNSTNDKDNVFFVSMRINNMLIHIDGDRSIYRSTGSQSP